MRVFRFDRFSLDPADRRLLRDEAPVELNARYFDALALLVGEAGKLVSKDRFLDEVWRGVPVTDEALTQCVKALRRALGDDASRPRFIETVPKHGYRFVAPVEALDGAAASDRRAPAPAAQPKRSWREPLLLGASGTIGAGVSGLIGGLLYGFAAASQPSSAGAASVLLVLLWLTLVVALIGGAAVSFGIAAGAGRSGRPSLWSIAGGACGGLVVGAVVKLLGLDAFNLLLGQSPGEITGAAEGALLGAGVGLGAWLATRPSVSLRRGVALAGLAGAGSGALIALFGGRLMGGSLLSLARAFPDSRLRLDPLGAVAGEADFGPVAQAVTGALEAMLFAACVAAGIILGRRRLERKYGAQRD
jgi:DNA-binding winged helix-turn-helix (wHTH) protein